jgi:hypothetical protein
MSWCRAPSVWQLRSWFCGAPSLTRGRVCVLCMLLALASAVFLGSESLGTRDHILLSQIWDFPFRRLLRLAESRWGYSTPPPHGFRAVSVSQSYITTDGQSASLSWNKAPIRGLRPDLCYCQTFRGLFMSSLYRLRTDNTENTIHVISNQRVHWRADCCLATSYNIRPLRNIFHCCPLERVYQAVA